MRGLGATAALVAWLFLLAAVPAGAAPPQINHVWIVVLENKNYDTSFGPGSPAPYLASTLPSQGQLLTQYYGIGHASLDNYIAMASGQPPNPVTQADCTTFSDFLSTGTDANGVALGQGCVYPSSVKTIADQIEAKRLTWRQYAEDMAASSTEPKTCRHPAVGAADMSQAAKPTDQYATRHVPFVYFHSIIDRPICDTNVVDLSALQSDLTKVSTTPSYSFITPDLCSDGHDKPCVDGRPGGLVSVNDFLQTWIPRILASPAYKQDGLLIVTFDEGSGDATACCNEQPSPNLAPGGQNGNSGPGGGRTGTVLLSPYIKPGGVNNTPYNHYAMLRSVEDIFGLSHLALAGQAGLKPFGNDVFTDLNGSKPTVNLTNVPAAGRCAASSFAAKVAVISNRLRNVRAFVDGKQIAAKRTRSFSLKVSTKNLRRGKHKLVVRATDKLGRSAQKSATFRTCR
jgi:hypothetical protein